MRYAVFAVVVATGCLRPIPQCHAIVNDMRYDADNTGPAWCEQLQDSAHLLNVQLFTGEHHARPIVCDAYACLDVDDDAIRVSLNRDLVTQPITPGGAAVWFDIGSLSCHDFRGTIVTSSPSPNWSFSIDGYCASDSSLTMEARLFGDI